GQIFVKSGDIDLVNRKDVFGKFEYDATSRSLSFNAIDNANDVTFTSANIPNGKISGQILSATDSVQIARNEVALLADQLTKSVNVEYAKSTGLGETRFLGAKAFALNTITAPTSDIIIQANHGLAAGDKIRLINLSNNTVTEGIGLNEGNTYFVKSVNGNTIQLSATKDGDAVQITSNITSASTFRRVGDPPIAAPVVNSETLRTSDRPGGGNQIALNVAALGTKAFTGLVNSTFTAFFNKTVTTVAQQLSSTNIRLEDQKLSEQNAINSRDQYSGVSQDEEITDMMKFQRSFQASARHINVIDTLLEQVVNRLGVG
ncbi:MAG: flagellar basal body rod C-terminal domain-containing protein, partial [Verrucomicrobiota bacterium]